MSTTKTEFESATEHLMDYLRKNHHPHCTVIVTSTTSELVEGLMSHLNPSFPSPADNDAIRKALEQVSDSKIIEQLDLIVESHSTVENKKKWNDVKYQLLQTLETDYPKTENEIIVPNEEQENFLDALREVMDDDGTKDFPMPPSRRSSITPDAWLVDISQYGMNCDNLVYLGLAWKSRQKK